jgi:hypothetical protein
MISNDCRRSIRSNPIKSYRSESSQNFLLIEYTLGSNQWRRAYLIAGLRICRRAVDLPSCLFASLLIETLSISFPVLRSLNFSKFWSHRNQANTFLSFTSYLKHYLHWSCGYHCRLLCIVNLTNELIEMCTGRDTMTCDDHKRKAQRSNGIRCDMMGMIMEMRMKECIGCIVFELN